MDTKKSDMKTLESLELILFCLKDDSFFLHILVFLEQCLTYEKCHTSIVGEQKKKEEMWT